MAGRQARLLSPSLALISSSEGSACLLGCSLTPQAVPGSIAGKGLTAGPAVGKQSEPGASGTFQRRCDLSPWSVAASMWQPSQAQLSPRGLNGDTAGTKDKGESSTVFAFLWDPCGWCCHPCAVMREPGTKGLGTRVGYTVNEPLDSKLSAFPRPGSSRRGAGSEFPVGLGFLPSIAL